MARVVVLLGYVEVVGRPAPVGGVPPAGRAVLPVWRGAPACGAGEGCCAEEYPVPVGRAAPADRLALVWNVGAVAPEP
ncbi:hypothetical protein [Raineyella sp. W15-4]|uniref:hypothetical protein n=1 Tax=Raineyella sp. W15-4 TaxID=3081651 RepID=UPI002952DD38|nr:hypothetical protein [Raineyella sp. W15-4]WOQ15854.1 hypothetical protein R0145_11535 [Raineyella sp. W15-4]